jgi:hypothetical protein
MPEAISDYIIEPSATMVAHPRLYRVLSISGVEISKQEVSFAEVAAANPELFEMFLVQYKQYLIDFANQINPENGVNALNQESIRSFEKGLMYAASYAKSVED